MAVVPIPDADYSCSYTASPPELGRDKHSLFLPPKRGLRFRAKARPANRRGYSRHATRGHQRKAITHVAVICDDATLQPFLPQIILASTKAVPAQDVRYWRPLPKCGAELWREKSAWINAQVFVRILRRLGARLREKAKGRQAILLMDAHSVHTSPIVLAEARRQKLWIVIIPASMTGLLQPLDTDIFSRFKAFFRTELQRWMLEGPNVEIKAVALLHALQVAIKGVLQRHPWSPIFKKNGFGSEFDVRSSILETLELRSPPPLPTSLPNLQQFQQCFIRGAEIPFMELLGGLLPQRPRKHSRVREELAIEDDEEEDLSWAHRLRPRRPRYTSAARAAPIDVLMPEPVVPPSPPPLPPPKAAPPSATTATGIPLTSARRFPPRRQHSSSAVEGLPASSWEHNC